MALSGRHSEQKARNKEGKAFVENRLLIFPWNWLWAIYPCNLIYRGTRRRPLLEHSQSVLEASLTDKNGNVDMEVGCPVGWLGDRLQLHKQRILAEGDSYKGSPLLLLFLWSRRGKVDIELCTVWDPERHFYFWAELWTDRNSAKNVWISGEEE